MRNTSIAVGPIAGTLFEPAGDPAAALVIHPATATPAGFYTGLASFLAENGIAAVTYDYRGTGRSGSPRDHREVGMREWMESDVPAVAAWTAQRFPGRRTLTPADAGVSRIGHHGLMRRNVRDTLWPDLLTWLQKQVANASS